VSADPWEDPRVIDRERAWRLHCQRTRQHSLSRADFGGALDAFLERVDAMLVGRLPSPDPELESLATHLGLPATLPTDPRREPEIDAIPDACTLARVASDIAPSVGMDAPDRLLGPWADVLDPRRSTDRVVLIAVLAAACFVPVDGDRYGRTPFVQWVRRKPHPGLDLRARFRAVEHAPPSAWRLVARDGDGWQVRDLVGISPEACPDGPLRIDLLASVEDAGAPGDLLLARAIRTEDGWVAPFGFAVRGLPEPAVLKSWIRLDLCLQALDQRIPSLDDVLRRHPQLLVRRAHEWAWARGA